LLSKRAEAGLADETDPAAAQIARETNAHILALEERFGEVSAHARRRDLIRLFCECGCMAIVATTRSKYEAMGGAWVNSHKPPGSTH
jgi:hypothetical protein